MKSLLFACLTTLTLVACQSSAELTKAEKQTVIDDAGKMLQSYYDDIAVSGLMAEFPYLDSSADFFWVPPGFSNAISYDSVAIYIRQNALLFSKVINKWDTLHITPLTNQLASYTGVLHSTITDTSGVTETYSMIETGLLIKRDDKWKLLNGQTAALP
jgi:hypothetical protein